MKIRNRILLIFCLLTVNDCSAQIDNLQGGANDVVNCFYNDSNLLFVGGAFTQIGNQNINQLATWDGLTWNTFGSNDLLINSFGTSGNVLAIIRYNNEIIIAGDFDSIGLVPVHNIARWNGISWTPLGD